MVYDPRRKKRDKTCKMGNEYLMPDSGNPTCCENRGNDSDTDMTRNTQIYYQSDGQKQCRNQAAGYGWYIGCSGFV